MKTISFKSTEHTYKPEVQILEILLDSEMVATIYPDEEHPGSIKLVSAHFAGELTHSNQFPDGVKMDTGEGVYPPIPAIRITFDQRKYRVGSNCIIREQGVPTPKKTEADYNPISGTIGP